MKHSKDFLYKYIAKNKLLKHISSSFYMSVTLSNILINHYFLANTIIKMYKVL